MFNIKTSVLHQAKIEFAFKTSAVSIMLTLGWLYFFFKYLVGNQIIKKKNFKMIINEIWDFSSAVKSACPSVNPRPRQFNTYHIIRFNRRSTLLRNVGFLIVGHHLSVCGMSLNSTTRVPYCNIFQFFVKL